MLSGHDQLKTDGYLTNNRYTVVGLTNFFYPRTCLYIIRSSCPKGWFLIGMHLARTEGEAKAKPCIFKGLGWLTAVFFTPFLITIPITILITIP